MPRTAAKKNLESWKAGKQEIQSCEPARSAASAPSAVKYCLVSPGTAIVTADGMIRLFRTDLGYAELGGPCSLHVDAHKRALTIRHGQDHAIITDPYFSGSALIGAKRELRALGLLINVSDPVVAQVVRHTDGNRRWLELRFPPEAMKARSRKTKREPPGRGEE